MAPKQNYFQVDLALNITKIVFTLCAMQKFSIKLYGVEICKQDIKLH